MLYALFKYHLHPLTTSNWYQHPRNSTTTLHPMDPPKAMRRSAPRRESSAPHISPAMTRSITPLPRSGNPKGGKNGNRILAASSIHLYTKLLIRYVLRKKLHPTMLSHIIVNFYQIEYSKFWTKHQILTDRMLLYLHKTDRIFHGPGKTTSRTYVKCFKKVGIDSHK